ncbi:hypothetical protein HZS_2775, partial [Henneguya salminicola]
MSGVDKFMGTFSDIPNSFDEDQFTDLMGFSNFGKIRNKTKSYNRVLESSKTGITPTKVVEQQPPRIIDGESESDEESDSETNKIEDEIYVCGISIDSSGSRMLTAGHDFHIKMYDFATMDSNFRPFRTFDPLEDVPLRAIKHSPAGDLVMVYGGSSFIKLMDRDGKSVCDCHRGDRYIFDMNQTRGHTSEVNSAVWNPIDLDCFVTCGMDSTVRIWSVEKSDMGCKRVIKVKTRGVKNNPCVEIVLNGSGTLIYGSCTDGCINVWDPRKSTPVPAVSVSSAHQNGSPAYSMAISRNDQILVSRGFDDTLKTWDLRNFKVPIHSINLPNYFDRYVNTRVIFSPDYRLIITGTSERRGNENCFLNFYRVEDLSLCKSIPFEGTSPIIPVWHPKLNQLLVGCSDGNIKVFFDPKRSMKGVLFCMTKIHETKIDVGESLIQEQVFNPYSRQDGMEMTNVNVRKLQIKARRDPFLTRKPEPPVYGPGQGGRLTTAMSLSAFVCKQMLPIVAPSDDSNPREAILKYAQ